MWLPFPSLPAQLRWITQAQGKPNPRSPDQQDQLVGNRSVAPSGSGTGTDAWWSENLFPLPLLSPLCSIFVPVCSRHPAADSTSKCLQSENSGTRWRDTGCLLTSVGAHATAVGPKHWSAIRAERGWGKVRATPFAVGNFYRLLKLQNNLQGFLGKKRIWHM